MTPSDSLPELPPGYTWSSDPHPTVRTPFGATISGCYGDCVEATLENRAAAARRCYAWAQQNGTVSCVPVGVRPDLWWAFVSRADASIYPHLLSHVEESAEWMLFNRAGLTQGALAVYTDTARRSLSLAAGALSGKHDAEWAAFANPVASPPTE